MNRYTHSIVASGHSEVCRAAGQVLEAGGNAFDAIVAGGFASAVVEPALTSLGGGGLLVGYNATENREVYYDFFVDTPGKGRDLNHGKLHFFPVTVEFSGASQDFNVGYGSVAVPGTLKGLLHTHKQLGRLPLSDILHPAKQLAAGHTLNDQQAHFLYLLNPIMTMFHRGKSIYMKDGLPLAKGDIIENSKLVDFLGQVELEGDESFYRGEIARSIDREMRDMGGLLSYEDLAGYLVKERTPLKVPYRGRTFVTPSEPSMGGTLIALSLSLQQSGDTKTTWGSADHLTDTLYLMKRVEELRSKGVINPEALEEFLSGQGNEDWAVLPRKQFQRGTTHISIADDEGNCASMTCSNGEGSGYFAPSTGVMLNNMMGEDDLHPDGFHSDPPGVRVGSMMSPSLLTGDDGVELVIGSGGSKRIRTAISQVVSQLVDHGRGLREAVSAPRLYWDEDRLQIEPGFSAESVKALREVEETVLWQNRDVYFGGVHGVIPGKEGAGDPRRGGAVLEVKREV